MAIAATSDKETIVAVYDMEGMISESGQVSSGLFDLSGSSDRPLTHTMLCAV